MVHVNIDNILDNIKLVKDKYKTHEYYMAVLKGSAYGHGEYIAKYLDDYVNYVAVATLNEALRVREYNKIIPILLLEPVSLDKIDIVIDNNLTITVGDIRFVKDLVKLDFKEKIKVHLKVDSGLNRLGFKLKEELSDAYDILAGDARIIIEGIYSHFATAGILDNYWDKQVANFKEITSKIDIMKIPIRHMGSSITLVTHPKLEFTNGIRIGTLMYGYPVGVNYSNKGIKNKLRKLRNTYLQKKLGISEVYTNVDLKLKPAFKYYTHILQIKRVKKGEYVGYACLYKAEKDMTVGVLPIGYNEGIGRINKGRYVIIKDKTYPFIGEIGMNMSFIKLDDDITLNDEVLVLGNAITLGLMSRWMGVTPHEALLSIGKNNSKTYVKNSKIDKIIEK